EADGFVYCVSRRGVTGSNTAGNTIDWNELAEEMAAMCAETAVPLCVGFGITTPEDVRNVANLSDGAIIGTALQKLIEENPQTARETVSALIHSFHAAIHD
ncbi:MAG: tryptophan synthase subunit alpha, partial [Planctomycetaceae bacterium]|nr:tryptophan synthase subunit alpha [Planctomycetaceae bacterium]